MPPMRVGDRIADAQRRALGVAGDAHHAGQALDDLVVGGRVAHRAFLAEAGDRAIDQARVDLLQGRRSRRPAASITPGRKFSTSTSALATRRLKTSLPASCLRLSVIDFLPAFCARNEAPISFALSAGSAPSWRARSPRPGHLDLDHVGAEQRQLIGAERPGQHIGQVEDADAVRAACRSCDRSAPDERVGTSRSVEIQTVLISQVFLDRVGARTRGRSRTACSRRTAT